MEKCTQVKTIERIENALYGNGQKGLVKDVEIIKTENMEMKDDLKKMSTSISAIAKSFTERDAIEGATANAKEGRNKAIQKVGTVFGIAFGLIGLACVILEKIG